MKRKYIYLFVAILFFAGGCNDFLENPPKGYLTTAGFPVTSSDALLATNGIYNTLRIWNFHAGGFPILDIMSDEARKGSNPGDALVIASYDNFTFTPSEQSLERWWSTLYQGIRRANLVLESLPDINMNQDMKNRLTGEASFLRAYFYFTLVRAFGDVPEVLTTNVSKDLGRTSKDVIYDDVIIPDLETAIDFLPEKSDYSAADLGRATRGAAKGILAKVYLFRHDFVNAEKYAMEVINSGQYSLDPDFSHVFSTDGEYGPGSVFEIGALPDNNMVNGGDQYGNTWGVRGVPNLGWGFGRPSWALIQFFGNDPRKDETIIFLGETLDGIKILGDGSTPDTTYTDATKTKILEIECYNQKTFTPGTETRFSFGYNRRILRYADILLMAAEALNENGKPQQALTYLNEVRARARGNDPNVLPDITVTDQDQLRDLILEERHRELALEGHRFWDLVRTGKAPEVLGPLGFVTGKNEILPIPENEVNISEGLIKQNPNY